MEDFKQNYQMVVADPSAIAAAESAKARIQAAYIMAINRRRNSDDARTRILEACKRPEFAARVEYAKPVAGSKIKGPSIRFAETALRLWGNIDSDISVVYDDAEFRRINIRVTDLETNSTFSKQINIRKTVERKNTTGRDGAVIGQRLNSKGETVYIVQSTDDELMNKENALISKALRNEGLRLIPSDIIDEALVIARETLSNRDAKDPHAAKKGVMDAFSSIGVKPLELEKYLKHKLDIISTTELADLRAIYSAIKEGDASWIDYVRDDSAESDKKTTPPAPTTFQDDKQPEKAPQPEPALAQKPEVETSSPPESKDKEQKAATNHEPLSELDKLNERFGALLKTSTLKVKAALLNCKLSPKTERFKDVMTAEVFFKEFEKATKFSK
jgi:hypothetical protein